MGLKHTWSMIIYFIKSGETLDTIAQKINIENPKYLREYHNARCNILDRIPENGSVRFSQRFCIPSAKEIEEINALIRERGESLRYLLPKGKFPITIPLMSGEYAVKQSEVENDISKNEHAYQIDLQYTKKENNQHHFHFSVTDWKKEGEEPDDKINSLASDIAKIMYPVTLIVDEVGNFVAAQPNKEENEIITQLEKLKKYHYGSVAASHIDRMKDRIADPQVIEHSLKKIMALQFLFSPFHQINFRSYDTSVIYQTEISWLPLSPPVVVEVEHQTLQQENPRFIEILQTGKPIHPNCKEDNPSPELYSQSFEGEHSAKYIIDAKDFSIQKIEAHFRSQVVDKEIEMQFELQRILK